MNLLRIALIDITLALVIAFALLPLLRRQSAALRHCALAVSLGLGTLLPLTTPLLAALLPPLPIGTPGILELTSSGVVSAPQVPATPPSGASAGTVASAARWSSTTALVAVWALGSIAALTALGVGFLRVSALARAATVMRDPRWTGQLRDLCIRLGIGQEVTLLESRDPRFLVVWGLRRPRVLIPTLAREWPEERIRLVLTHELAHVQRRDWVVQCFAEIVRAVYWFHPLAWLACARLRRESDHACDDVVLAGGSEGPEYATHLVEVARTLRHHRSWLPAHAIAHTTGFERRVQAMLDTEINRRQLSRGTLALTTALALLLALPIVALTAAQGLVSFTGSVLDPTNAVLPNAVITLTNVDTGAKYEVRTNRDGRYEIPGLPAGRYTLQSKVLGFEDTRLDLAVGAENVQRDLRLELGSLQETITLTTGPGAANVPVRQMTPEQKTRLEEVMRKRAAQRCPEQPAGAAPIGGNIRVPIKLRDERPVYPAALANNGVSGKVELETVLGTDGHVDRMTVKSASNSEFAEAAMEAVRQWEFDATLLNCVAVETRMHVTVNFEYRP